MLIAAALQGDMCDISTKPLELPVQFAFISQIGGMRGGSSATSNSIYLSRTGLVQVSKEETNGRLHELMASETDTAEFFKKINKHEIFSTTKQPSIDKEHSLATEYYPPTTFVSYSIEVGGAVLSEYFGQAEHASLRKTIIDDISAFIARVQLKSTKAGLYVRAQRLPIKNLNIIQFDLFVESQDLISLPTLRHILKNEMALVYISDKDDSARIDDRVAIRAGNHLHIRVGAQPYVLFVYYYKGGLGD